jgi:hypothetical protein
MSLVTMQQIKPKTDIGLNKNNQTHPQQQKNKKNLGIPHTIPSEKVYRQIFDAQVQLIDAYEKVKEKYHKNPVEIKVKEDGIPLVNESRGLRGQGILTKKEEKWINSDTNDFLVNNPIYDKYKTESNAVTLKEQKKNSEQNDVIILPDTVIPATIGSDIETRLNETRRKKHEKTWEDMLQDIGLVNLNLEPEIHQISKNALFQLAESDKIFRVHLDHLKSDDAIIKNGSNQNFLDIKVKLLEHTENCKQFIDKMDADFIQLENRRVNEIREIIKTYSDQIFQINYLKRPDLEKLFDNQIQQLNHQILENKASYAKLYSKLIIADLEREKGQMLFIEQRLNEWRLYEQHVVFLNLETFIQNFDMLNMMEEETCCYETEFKHKQIAINSNRIGLVNALKAFKPPDSTKQAVYKWFESITAHTRNLDEINSNFLAKLRSNFEASNLKVIEKLDTTMEYLIKNQIIEKTRSNEIFESKLLPMWSRKQKSMEDYMESVEKSFDQMKQILGDEIEILFKYMQGVSFIWDKHEVGLMKRERALQEMLQDCRHDHDNENQVNILYLNMIIECRFQFQFCLEKRRKI